MLIVYTDFVNKVDDNLKLSAKLQENGREMWWPICVK
jgi:hypothetical protein